MAKQAPIFDHTACPRCGGYGQYSYNQMHGTRCYGCNGSGYQLTKRGEAARKYMDDLRSVPAGSVKVGELIWFDMFDVKCCERVISVEPDAYTPGLITITGRRTKTGELIAISTLPDKPVLRGLSADEKQQIIDAALAYQATLPQ